MRNVAEIRTEKVSDSKYLNKIECFEHLPKITQIALVKITFDRGASIRMTVYGNSMFPFIRNGDVITLSPWGKQSPQIGDIVAFEQAGAEKLIIHRLIQENQEWYILRGDNCSQPDEVVPRSHLLGILTQIKRKDKTKCVRLGKTKNLITWLSRNNILSLMQFFFHIPTRLKNLVQRLIPKCSSNLLISNLGRDDDKKY